MKSINNKFQILALLILIGIAFSACEDDVTNPPNSNEEEVITTLTLKFTESPGGNISTFTFRDADGPGGNAPSTFDTIRLTDGKDYLLELSLLDESGTTIEDITEEVEQEGTEHQFFFTGSSVDNQLLTVSYDDVDTDGNPIGLIDSVSTLIPGNGVLTITLRHEPTKTANGVANGDITNAGGETDVEIDFSIVIQ